MKLPISLAWIASTALLVITLIPPTSLCAQSSDYQPLEVGEYVGAAVRVSPAGEVQRGQVRLDLAADGRILIGVFDLPATATLPAVFQQIVGQIEPASRRGFLRLVHFEPASRQFVVEPGTEKIALFLYLDGRLVGGSADAQGGSLALRAAFQPMTPLPAGPPTP